MKAAGDVLPGLSVEAKTLDGNAYRGWIKVYSVAALVLDTSSGVVRVPWTQILVVLEHHEPPYRRLVGTLNVDQIKDQVARAVLRPRVRDGNAKEDE